jgi:spermidine synthase
VKTDHAATVVAAEDESGKHLFVNGVGMTGLTPITKMMAHFPAAHLDPREGRRLEGLVICFGMGTSLRALASWGADVTAVELIPSVPSFFGFYFPDGPGLLARSKDRLRIEIDDGRRFLDRTPRQYDLITVDPPPPVEAAASSLLYSKEFYASAKPRLKPGGILQAWLPGGDPEIVAGVTLAVLDSFPHVRVFRSVWGWGYHYLASMQPIPRLTSAQLLSRMPASAVGDMTEWEGGDPRAYLETMLAREVDPESLFIGGSRARSVAVQDDRPINEFFFVRRYLSGRARPEP